MVTLNNNKSSNVEIDILKLLDSNPASSTIDKKILNFFTEYVKPNITGITLQELADNYNTKNAKNKKISIQTMLQWVKCLATIDALCIIREENLTVIYPNVSFVVTQPQKESILSNQPCYYAVEKGILTCNSCPAKFVCDKSPERKNP
jgi:hypothetical protein